MHRCTRATANGPLAPGVAVTYRVLRQRIAYEASLRGVGRADGLEPSRQLREHGLVLRAVGEVDFLRRVF